MKNSSKARFKKTFITGLIIGTIIVSILLYVLISHYIDVFKTFYLINANILGITIRKIQIGENITEYEITIEIQVENPSNLPIFIESIYLDSISGVYLNNRRLYYVSYPRKGIYTEIPPLSSKEFSLTMRIYDESSPDLQYLKKALKSGILNWVFPLRSLIRVSFKSGIVDLTCRYNGTYFLEDQS